MAEPMTEGEALRRSRDLLERSDASVDFVAEKILRDQPDAGPAELGGIFDAHGSGSWAPQRSPAIDWSRWGRWEAWEHCTYEGGRVVPSGDWCAWDSATGQQLGFGDKSVKTGRLQAEELAVYMNGGAATRVVSLIGASASALKYQEVRAMVDSRIDADTKAAIAGERAALQRNAATTI